MRKKKPPQPFAIPQGAAIYGTVTESFSQGNRTILVHGEGGPTTGVRVKKGVFEITLPATTIVGVSPGPIHIAWDGIGYQICRSLKEIQADDRLTLIGSVEIPPKTPPPLPFGRPPLAPLTCEAIDQLLHRVDEQHWPAIASFRIKKHYPLDVPVPPQTPQHLMGAIRWYASMLYGTEADHYDQFRSQGSYPGWLSRLSDRVIARVMAAVERLDTAEADALLLNYHGLRKDEIERELRKFLWEIGRQYEQGDAPSQKRQRAPAATPVPPQPTPTPSNSPAAESIASQLKRLQNECDLTTAEMAEAIGVDERSVRRHLAEDATPRRTHLAAYEKLFTERSGKTVVLKRPRKGRPHNVRKTSETSEKRPNVTDISGIVLPNALNKSGISPCFV